MKMQNLKAERETTVRRASHSGPSVHANSRAKKDTRIIWRAFQYYLQLNRVRSYVSEHPGETITLDKAAKIAAMARNYFADFFHRNTGVTFKYWIDFRRVNRAASLLRSSNLSILEVALECGFVDATTFTRTFRRMKRITPREFRRFCRPVNPRI